MVHVSCESSLDVHATGCNPRGAVRVAVKAGLLDALFPPWWIRVDPRDCLVELLSDLARLLVQVIHAGLHCTPHEVIGDGPGIGGLNDWSELLEVLGILYNHNLQYNLCNFTINVW